MTGFRKHPWGFWPSRSRGGKGSRSSRQRSARPQLEALEGRLLLAVFTVTNTNDSGAGSLRQAILDANANHGLDTIAFNIGSGGVQTIRPTSPLPTIADPVILDGTTQPGYAGTPLIELNGGNAGSTANGLAITAGGSTVKGLVINGFRYSAIFISDAGGNVVVGNYLGTDVTGAAAVANGGGVTLNSANNTVGGTTAAARNLISGNSFNGVQIGADHNVVQGNFIGMDSTGERALGSQPQGIDVSGGQDTTIGGAVPGAGNVISGNGQGVLLEGFERGSQVQGNLIGTNAGGTRVVGNRIGVQFSAGDTLGGTTVAARNVISGNSEYGILGGAYSIIQGNFIGTDATGNAALGNGTGIDEAFYCTIGGTVPGAGNVISGNTEYGILRGAYSVIQGNFIGTDATGNATLGNGTGIGGAFQCMIGGTVPGAGNVISGNALYGIEAEETAQPDVIQGNRIGTNAAGTGALANSYGVYLVDSPQSVIGGTTAAARNLISGNVTGVFIAAGDGNQVMGNYIGTDVSGTRPVGNADGVVLASGLSTVGGEVAGAGNLISGNSRHGVAVFGNGNVVAGNFIGLDATASVALANGIGVFVTGADNRVGGTVAGARNVISGQATGLLISGAGATGNRVEGNYVGTDATGTAAVANFEGVMLERGASANTIGGEVAGAGNVLSGNMGEGVYVVQACGNVVLGNLVGTDASGRRALSNGGGIGSEVDVSAGSCAPTTVGGTAPGDRNVLSGNRGIAVVGYGLLIEGNYIGTDVTGTQVLGNLGGVDAERQVTVGGTVAGAGNLISGNHIGLSVTGNDVLVEGNWIGTDVTGTVPLGNEVVGIGIDGPTVGVTIGGTVPGSGNLISGNLGPGIGISKRHRTFFPGRGPGEPDRHRYYGGERLGEPSGRVDRVDGGRGSPAWRDGSRRRQPHLGEPAGRGAGGRS